MGGIRPAVAGQDFLQGLAGRSRFIPVPVQLAEQQQGCVFPGMLFMNDSVLFGCFVVAAAPDQDFGQQHPAAHLLRIFSKIALQPGYRLLASAQAQEEDRNFAGDIIRLRIADQGLLIGLQGLLVIQGQFGVPPPEKIKIGTAVIDTFRLTGGGRHLSTARFNQGRGRLTPGRGQEADQQQHDQ